VRRRGGVREYRMHVKGGNPGVKREKGWDKSGATIVFEKGKGMIRLCPAEGNTGKRLLSARGDAAALS